MAKGFKLQIYSFKEIDSTQKYLKRALAAKELHAPVAVVADIQTDGIGSRNNSWESVEGNLFLSFALPVTSLVGDLPLASASIYYAYILKETLEKMGSAVWLKWPNDFYLDDKKIGGMITSLYKETLICGVGLNLKKSPKTFSTLDIIVQRDELLKRYFKNIEKNLLWKQVFSKYKLEFHRNQEFFTHINGERKALKNAFLCEDGSLDIDGERIYSLR
jgi:BirA family biotin operon repressor/biotin-[acetyl-CoA-carboxylase] ligase